MQNKRTTLAVNGVAIVPQAIETQNFAIECQESLALVPLRLDGHLFAMYLCRCQIPWVHVHTGVDATSQCCMIFSHEDNEGRKENLLPGGLTAQKVWVLGWFYWLPLRHPLYVHAFQHPVAYN